MRINGCKYDATTTVPDDSEINCVDLVGAEAEYAIRGYSHETITQQADKDERPNREEAQKEI